MRKILFVYNPVAGKGLILNRIKDYKKVFSDMGDTCVFYETKGKETDEKALARKLKYGFDQIICAGGDGTLNDVISILLKNRCTVPLSIIPVGSTNDYAHSIGISRDPEQAFRTAVEAKHKTEVDVGRLGDRNFMYVAAFGAFTDTTYTTPQEWKRRLGYIAYFFKAVFHLFAIRAEKLQIRTDKEDYEGKFIDGIISNAHFVGGFRVLNDNASMNDGLLEVLLIRNPKTIFGLFPIAAAILARRINPRYMISFQTPSIVIEDLRGKGIDWNTDGEFGGKYTKVEIRTEEHRLTIIT